MAKLDYVDFSVAVMPVLNTSLPFLKPRKDGGLELIMRETQKADFAKWVADRPEVGSVTYRPARRVPGILTAVIQPKT